MAGYIYRGTPQQPTPRQPCGTNAAYYAHRRRNETPCSPCVEAKRDHDRQYQRKRYAQKMGRL